MPPKIVMEPQLDFRDVLIEPHCSDLSSRSQVSLQRKFVFKNGASWQGVPVVAANMDTTGTFNVCRTLRKNKMLTAMNKFYTAEDYVNEPTFKKNKAHNHMYMVSSGGNDTYSDPDMYMVSSGIGETDFKNLKDVLQETGCGMICIDVANGYMKALLDFCKKVRAEYPDKIIVAGNVATKERVQELIVHGGVDIVKVGIGPGSACTTRVKTGVGVPQLSAVLECAEAAHRAGGFVMADGGITCPGDLAKAFGAGADFVMMGGQFAGHDENPGNVIEENGKKYKEFYGMSSEHAMNKHYGGMQKYRSSEGRYLRIPYKGGLQNTVDDFLGGLRSTCSYVGATTIEELPKKTTFRVVGQQFNPAFL